MLQFQYKLPAKHSAILIRQHTPSTSLLTHDIHQADTYPGQDKWAAYLWNIKDVAE